MHFARLFVPLHTKLKNIMKLIKGVFEEKLELQFAPSIRAGFPSPADEYLIESLDFNRVNKL